jgi:hypothetical protein
MTVVEVEVSTQAREIIARIAAIDRERPHLDRTVAERVIREHFLALEVDPLPVLWVDDAGQARSAAWSAPKSEAWSAAWSAVESAAQFARGNLSEIWAEYGHHQPAEAAAWNAVWAAEAAARGAAQRAARAAAERAARAAAEEAVRAPSVSDWWTEHQAGLEAEKKARSTSSLAIDAAEWSAAWVGPVPESINRWLALLLPFVEACEAGLWLFWVAHDRVVAVPRPTLFIEDDRLQGTELPRYYLDEREDRLHRADGPAVSWPNGTRYWFGHGVRVSQQIIESPETLHPRDDILAEPNVEVRRIMLERYGYDRFIRGVHAERVHEDDFGVLWCVPMPDEPLVVVSVHNPTAEPDGSHKTYFLRVDPQLRPLFPLAERRGELQWLREQAQRLTARNAVASTFGLRGEEYAPATET